MSFQDKFLMAGKSHKKTNGFVDYVILLDKENKMGYEQTLLIGSVHSGSYYDEDLGKCTNEFQYFSVYAHIDLCKTNIALKHDGFDKPCYFYDFTEGNTQVIKDYYDNKLMPFKIREVVSALENADKEYRRHKWAIALLKNMQETAKEDLFVLVYGH